MFGRGLYEVVEQFWTAPQRADGGEVEAEFAREYAATPRIAAARRASSSDRPNSSVDGGPGDRAPAAPPEHPRHRVARTDGPAGAGALVGQTIGEPPVTAMTSAVM